MKMAQEIPELRFAVFGGSGSGKTTLISSYYGNQQDDDFEELHKYKLNADKPDLGNLLLQNYFNLEKGVFPHGTDKFVEYSFGLKVKDLPGTCMKIKWFDYPGGWWETSPADEAEGQARQTAFKNLLECHVGILLIDGVRYQKEGINYVRYLFDQFKNEIDKIIDSLAATGNPLTDFPKQWILAISKSDQLSPDNTVKNICKTIVSGAASQINGVGKVINSDSFGCQYLLLSSVKGSDSKIENAHENIGLTLIAPIALLAFINQLIADFPRKPVIGAFLGFIKKLRNFIILIKKLPIPAQYKVFIDLLLLILDDDLLAKTEVWFFEKADEAIKGKRSLEAVAYLMKARMVSDEAKKVYYCSQGIGNIVNAN